MAIRYDERELGNFTQFEHVNFRVPDHYQATLFFVEGLGFTRDPMRMVSVHNMWVNVGKQQFHLPLGDAVPFAGEVGVLVPKLTETWRTLRRLKSELRGTEFGYEQEGTSLLVSSPWGHMLRLHSADTLSSPLPQAIPYVNFWVPVGRAKGIAMFYRDILGVPSHTRKNGKLNMTTVNVGINQHFHFIEKADLDLPKHPNHIAVYLTHYQQIYRELKRRRLLMEPDNNEQFRFAKITNPNSNKILFEFEHEMRSLHHPDFLKPLVNRVAVPYPID